MLMKFRCFFFRILNNEEWYARTDLIDFISTIGIHFRMNKMLLKESVAKRLESERGMSFTEFTYQIFQSYDWLYLLQNYNCSFQVLWFTHVCSSRVSVLFLYCLNSSVPHYFLRDRKNCREIGYELSLSYCRIIHYLWRIRIDHQLCFQRWKFGERWRQLVFPSGGNVVEYDWLLKYINWFFVPIERGDDDYYSSCITDIDVNNSWNSRFRSWFSD